MNDPKTHAAITANTTHSGEHYSEVLAIAASCIVVTMSITAFALFGLVHYLSARKGYINESIFKDYGRLRWKISDEHSEPKKASVGNNQPA